MVAWVTQWCRGKDWSLVVRSEEVGDRYMHERTQYLGGYEAYLIRALALYSAMTQPLIQRIARQSKITFGYRPDASISPNLETLVSLTNDLKAADLNLPTDPRTANIAPPNSAPAAFIEVARDPTFTLAAFLLRKGASIPIHDHPGMIGICKVLYGKVGVTSFSPPRRIEFTSPTGTSSHGGYFGVDEEGSEELTADSPCTVLTPKQKNVHTIYALEHSAFFDVLGPPYAPEEGRNCNYYEDIPKTKFLDSDQMKKYERLRILKRIERPMWFYTELKPYTGPPAHARNV